MNYSVGTMWSAKQSNDKFTEIYVLFEVGCIELATSAVIRHYLLSTAYGYCCTLYQTGEH